MSYSLRISFIFLNFIVYLALYRLRNKNHGFLNNLGKDFFSDKDKGLCAIRFLIKFTFIFTAWPRWFRPWRRAAAHWERATAMDALSRHSHDDEPAHVERLIDESMSGVAAADESSTDGLCAAVDLRWTIAADHSQPFDCDSVPWESVQGPCGGGGCDSSESMSPRRCCCCAIRVVSLCVCH